MRWRGSIKLQLILPIGTLWKLGSRYQQHWLNEPGRVWSSRPCNTLCCSRRHGQTKMCLQFLGAAFSVLGHLCLGSSWFVILGVNSRVVRALHSSLRSRTEARPILDGLEAAIGDLMDQVNDPRAADSSRLRRSIQSAKVSIRPYYRCRQTEL
jgi:hypothetical protein